MQQSVVDIHFKAKITPPAGVTIPDYREVAVILSDKSMLMEWVGRMRLVDGKSVVEIIS